MGQVSVLRVKLQLEKCKLAIKLLRIFLFYNFRIEK